MGKTSKKGKVTSAQRAKKVYAEKVRFVKNYSRELDKIKVSRIGAKDKAKISRAYNHYVSVLSENPYFVPIDDYKKARVAGAEIHPHIKSASLKGVFLSATEYPEGAKVMIDKRGKVSIKARHIKQSFVAFDQKGFAQSWEAETRKAMAALGVRGKRFQVRIATGSVGVVDLQAGAAGDVAAMLRTIARLVDQYGAGGGDIGMRGDEKRTVDKWLLGIKRVDVKSQRKGNADAASFVAAQAKRKRR